MICGKAKDQRKPIIRREHTRRTKVIGRANLVEGKGKGGQRVVKEREVHPTVAVDVVAVENNDARCGMLQRTAGEPVQRTRLGACVAQIIRSNAASAP